MADISITELPVGTMSSDSIFPTSQPSAATGRVTTKLSGTEVGEGILGDIEYQGLNTINKTMFGAINEMLVAGSTGVAVTGTLLAGDTTVTLSDNAIHVTSLIDIFTGVYGVVPSAVAVNEGSVTLTFTAQAQDLPVAIMVRGIAHEREITSFWEMWDKVVRITGKANNTQDFQYTANLVRTLTFTGVPSDVENIVAHFYRNNFVFFFLRAGEELVYNVNGDAPYINCYRTTNFFPTLNETYAVSYNTQSSGNYMGKDPTWNSCIMCTCDIFDQNGDLIFAKNAELSDFNYTT